MIAPRINTNSLEWAAVRSNVDTELARLRELLEAPSLQPRETDVMRGRIAFARWLLDLPQRQLDEARAADIGPVTSY